MRFAVFSIMAIAAMVAANPVDSVERDVELSCPNGGHPSAKNVQKGQTCDSFAKQNGISFATLRKYNPELNAKCTNLKYGRKYCV